jgi:hypothetical protein
MERTYTGLMEEVVSRVIARAIDPNDDSGMEWERYVMAAQLLMKEDFITDRFIVEALPLKAQELDAAGNVPVRDEFRYLLSRMPVEVTSPPKAQE